MYLKENIVAINKILNFDENDKLRKYIYVPWFLSIVKLHSISTLCPLFGNLNEYINHFLIIITNFNLHINIYQIFFPHFQISKIHKRLEIKILSEKIIDHIDNNFTNYVNIWLWLYSKLFLIYLIFSFYRFMEVFVINKIVIIDIDNICVLIFIYSKWKLEEILLLSKYKQYIRKSMRKELIYFHSNKK